MDISEQIDRWRNKRILLIGEALTDRYIFGNADSISPDAPVPNVKISESKIHLGAIGLVLQYIRSLGGNPDICTILGNDYEGDFFFNELKKLNFSTENLIIDENISTPQITRIKAMGQHVLRLETDYSNELTSETTKSLLSVIENQSKNYDCIVILDYGAGVLFQDIFIRELLHVLKNECVDCPIIARPHTINYYLYENIDLIKINLQKALNQFSIDCCTETSVSIVGKRILNSTRCKNVFLNYLETDSYLFTRNQEKLEVIKPILHQPVRSFVAVGSAIMAVLGLAFAANNPVLETIHTSLYAAGLSAISPPVNFFSEKELREFITSSN